MACEQIKHVHQIEIDRMATAVLANPMRCYECGVVAEYTYNRKPYCKHCFLDAMRAKEVRTVKVDITAPCVVCDRTVWGREGMMILDDAGIICEECFENPETHTVFLECSSVKEIGG